MRKRTGKTTLDILSIFDTEFIWVPQGWAIPLGWLFWFVSSDLTPIWIVISSLWGWTWFSTTKIFWGCTWIQQDQEFDHTRQFTSIQCIVKTISSSFLVQSVPRLKLFFLFFFKFFPVANDFESKNKSYRLSILSQVKFLEFEYRILYVVTINEDGIGDHLSVSQSWPGRAAIITIQLLVFRIVDFTVADFCIVMYKGKLAEQREQDYATKLGNNSSILFTFLFTTCWSEPSSCLIVILSLEWFDSVKISRHVSTQDICLQWVFFSIKAYSFEKEWPIWRAITVERCSMNRR